jgi:hypothetical protein
VLKPIRCHFPSILSAFAVYKPTSIPDGGDKVFNSKHATPALRNSVPVARACKM